MVPCSTQRVSQSRECERECESKLTRNQHHTTEAGPPREKGVLKVVTTEDATVHRSERSVNESERGKRQEGGRESVRSERRERKIDSPPIILKAKEMVYPVQQGVLSQHSCSQCQSSRALAPKSGSTRRVISKPSQLHFQHRNQKN